MDIKELNKCIDEIDKISDSNWIKNLEVRKLKELEFHNKDRDQANIEEVSANDTYEKFYGNRKYYNITQRSNSYVNNWIKTKSKDKIFLPVLEYFFLPLFQISFKF